MNIIVAFNTCSKIEVVYVEEGKFCALAQEEAIECHFVKF